MTHEKWDVHTHTTLGPQTFEALSRFSHYSDFIRVRAHPTKPCCAEMVDSQGNIQRTIEENAYTATPRLQDCNEHKVTTQVLSPTPMMIPDYVDHPAHAAEICKILNDGNAELVSSAPKRFVALAALPMMSVEHSLKELERIQKLGMRGVEINSNVNNLDLDDPRFYPIFEALEAMDMAVMIHPWAGFMSPKEAGLKQRTQKNWRPWLLAMGFESALAFDALRFVHEKLPRLRVLYTHGGGVFPTLLGRLDHGIYCRPDLFPGQPKSPYDVIRDCSIYTDSLTHDPWVLGMLMDSLGVKRIAMGSDYPYPLGEVESQGLRNIYPGSMIEHLPESLEEEPLAWQFFPWLSRENSMGPKQLPCLSRHEKNQMLSKTAKEWLHWTSH